MINTNTHLAYGSAGGARSPTTTLRSQGCCHQAFHLAFFYIHSLPVNLVHCWDIDSGIVRHLLEILQMPEIWEREFLTAAVLDILPYWKWHWSYIQRETNDDLSYVIHTHHYSPLIWVGALQWGGSGGEWRVKYAAVVWYFNILTSHSKTDGGDEKLQWFNQDESSFMVNKKVFKGPRWKTLTPQGRSQKTVTTMML